MKVVARMEDGARRAALLVTLCAFVLLAGALLDVAWLQAPLGGTPMKPWTALTFIAAGVSLSLWARRRAPRAARALGAGVTGSGAAILAAWTSDGAMLVGARPALSTGVLFFVIGVALMVFEAKVRSARVAELLGIAAYAYWWSCAMDLAIGGLDGGPAAPAHPFVEASRQMSAYACGLFFFLPPTLLSARPRDGWMRIVSADTPSATSARRFIIALPLAIVAIASARYYGEVVGAYDARYGVSLMAAAMIFVLVTSAWLMLSSRFAAEEALRAQRNVLDAIVETIPHMIFAKDARTLRFQRFNKAGEALLGLTRSELIGKGDVDFFPPEQAAFFEAKDRAALAGDAPIDIPEEQIDTPRGKRWLHTVKVPVRNDDGTPSLLLGISEDITERKAADDELRRAKEAAEATSKELEAFSYAVSHDLRAPLRSIDGFSLAVMEDAGDKLDGDSRQNLERVRAAAQKMATLIDGLLNLSRVSRQPLRLEPVDLTAMATTVVAELRRAEPDRQVEVTIAPDLRATGDPRLVESMLQNLIGNAWKFTRKNSVAHIEVGAVDEEGERRFFVQDDGAGFDMAYAHKLFGAFQRLHGVTEFEGTGIGLATVQRIAQRHGGHVWAEAAVQRGARFTFRLGKAVAGSTLSDGSDGSDEANTRMTT